MKTAMFSRNSTALWDKLRGEYVLNRAQLEVLAAGLEARDRAMECRARIDAEGLTVENQRGDLRPHPLLSVERDSRAAFVHALQRLGLHLPAE